MRNILASFFFFLFINQGIISQISSKNRHYPKITHNTTIDNYFGKKVIDPYRNLENFDDTTVMAWVRKQNELYDTIIHNITSREILDAEMDTLADMRKRWASFPRMAGKRYFYPYGSMNEDIERLGYTDDMHARPIELFNTKEINEKDSSIYVIDYYEPSLDGKYLAFGISPDGSEKATIYIVDVEKKQLLPEKIEYSHAGDIQWLPDGTGFFYIKDKELKTEEDKSTFYEDAVVCLHKLHSTPSNDKPVLSRLLSKNLDLEKINWPRFYINPTSDKVLINFAKGSYVIVYYTSLKDILEKPAGEIVWKQICGREDKIGHNMLYGDRFFGLSYGKNPNGQLITMKLQDTTTRQVLYEGNDSLVLDQLILTYNSLYLATMQNGLNKLLKIDLKNYSVENIKLPFLGSLRLKPWFNIITSYQASDNLLFSLENYNEQWDIYSYNKNKQIIKMGIIPEIQYIGTPLELVIKETEVPSHDGAMVPLSIVYKKGLKLDGTNPVLIEAYGAYGSVEKPYFSRNRITWFSRGGIYAVAHVRGGGEKGDNWYKGGFKATKANSWKDLIACAEYLIDKKYTSSQNIGVAGYSAGGITVGRAITERPELFKAAVIYVGTLNPLRMEHTFNPSVDEFGSAKDSLGFKYLYNMDTYHHIKEGVNYPSVLFTAGLNDSRVVPWQPAKAVAKMQQVNKEGNLILFRVANSGHFDHPSTADVYSFLFWQLGHPDFKLNKN
jgi:prolyl oligopeptidase